MQKSAQAIWIMGAMLLGCGGPQADALTINAHEAEARREDREAREQAARYDPNERVFLGTATAGGAGSFAREEYNPTERYRERAEEHRQNANEHRQRASVLRASEVRECGLFTPETREACPLLAGIERVEDVEGGARITFAAGQDIGPIVQHLRCHFAFAAAQGRDGIESCALYVTGANVVSEGNTITLTTTEENLVPELRRRARVQAP